MDGSYINDSGLEVPENTILAVPTQYGNEEYKNIIQPLKGNPKRDWFTSHFYYCLPLIIGNQYGFGIKSLIDFDAIWHGEEDPESTIINILNKENDEKQFIGSKFGSGIITIQNTFHLKTPPGINLMTIQPPNYFIPGISAMTGVVETDNIRRDFTFNLKITTPNMKISVRQGDLIGAFIPIQRGFVDNFTVTSVFDFFNKEVYNNEIEESVRLSVERTTIDLEKPHLSGRRYFSGTHTNDTKYLDHQKRLD
jgi:hypothetical protein